MLAALVIHVALSAACLQDPAAKPVAPAQEVAPKLAAWLEEPSIGGRDRIRSELVELGAPIVPALQEIVTRREPAMGLALQVLCRIGEPARPALPQILAILGDREFTEPAGQPAQQTARGLLLESIGEAEWAADAVVPVLAKVAEDRKESDWFMSLAVHALGRMGRKALPVLSRWIADVHAEPKLRGVALSALGRSGIDALEVVRPIANDPNDPLQETARWHLAGMEERAGRMTREQFWAELIHKDPYGANVRRSLIYAKQTQNLQRLHPLTQEIKELWRKRLSEQPDAALAIQLAELIQDLCSNSELGYGASHEHWAKEDPLENYATMADALRLAQAHAEKLSPLWQRATSGLAKIALLSGDWNGMNARLAELGQPPVPADQRPWLTAPPKDWNALADHWKACDPSLRGGDGAFEVHVAKEGHGLRGAHVWLRQKPPESNVSGSGIDTHTLCLWPTPLTDEKMLPGESGFGYSADDREKTRYAVTDDSGVARFETLPAIEVAIEVMVPTANFTEPGSQWDLWTREADGSVALDHHRWHEGFQLESGKTVQGPSLVVRPHLAMNLVDGQAITDKEFVLTWPPTPETATTGAIHYEIELALSFPAGKALAMGPDSMTRLFTATVETKGNLWPLGAVGVGERKLVAGNVYVLQVTAKDANDGVVARYGRTACYVPWNHRKTSAPLLGDPTQSPRWFEEMAPIDAKLWHLGQFQDGSSGRVESLPQRLDRYLRAKPDAFEVDYVRVARAWLEWHDAAPNDTAAVAHARATLEELARTLPAGNVAGDTARRVVRQIELHADPGRSLEFAIARGP